MQKSQNCMLTCVRIILHNRRTQHTTVLSSRQALKLRCCLLKEMGSCNCKRNPCH